MALSRLISPLFRAMRGPRSAGVALAASLALFAPEAKALSPYLEIPDPAEAMKTPAYRYANMSDDEAFAELDKRGILYSREKAVPGVRAPIRLTGRLHGILIRSVLPPAERATTPFEILDARLALSLDDFTSILAAHDVDEVVHYTMYRPNVPKPADAKSSAPSAEPKPAVHSLHPAKRKAPAPPAAGKGAKGKETSELEVADASETEAKVPSVAPAKKRPSTATRSVPRARKTLATKHNEAPPAASESRESVPAAELDDDKPHGLWAPPGTRHPAGLAIDVGFFLKKDGSRLSVASDFDGKIGEQTCGAGAPSPSAAPARELRSIVCEAREKGVFTYTLTPNFNLAHHDHFHMEIKPGVTWFLYH